MAFHFTFSASSVFLVLYNFVTACAYLLALLVIIFVPITDPEHLKIPGIILGSGLFILAICGLVKWALNKAHGKFEISEMRRCKWDLAIGFGGIFIVSVIPRIFLFYVELTPLTVSTLLAIPLTAFLIFSMLFLNGTGKTVEHLDFSNSIPHWISSTIIQFILYVINVKYCIMTCEDEKKRNGIIALHSIFGLMSASSLPDFLTVLMDGLTAPSDWTNQNRAEAKELPVSKETNLPSCNDIFLYSYTIITVLMIAFSIIFLIFKPFTPEIKNVIFTIIGSSTLIFGIIGLLKWATSRRYQAEKFMNCRANLLIGLGGCLLFSIVPRVLVFVVGSDFSHYFSITFFSLLSTCTCYYLFIFGFRKICNLNYTNNRKLITITVLVNIFLFMATLRWAICSEARGWISLVQFVFCFLTASSSVDLAVVWNGGVYLKKEIVARNSVPLKTVKVVPEVPKVVVDAPPRKPFPRIECPICKLEYSDTKTPRILKGCGHTVCETCADSQLKKNHYISCPICKTVTAIRGPANTLHKNYAALELVQELEENNSK